MKTGLSPSPVRSSIVIWVSSLTRPTYARVIVLSLYFASVLNPIGFLVFNLKSASIDMTSSIPKAFFLYDVEFTANPSI